MISRHLNVALKVTLVALLLAAVAFHDAERFSDKAMGARAFAYPLLCALPAVIWASAPRRRAELPYPHAADALVTAPFVIDLAGNALDLFDRITWFDDAAHFVNWMLLGWALGLTLRPTRPAWEVIWLIGGAGAITAIVWELAEYTSFVQTVEQLGLYRDTIGDLALGTSGALTAGVIVAAINRRRRRDASGT